jgi:hypothetical protein
MRFRSKILALFLLSVILFGSNASSGAARQNLNSGGATTLAVAAGGDTCASPTVISTLPFNDSGDTTNATNTQSFFLNATCASGMVTRPGPDLVYSFTVFPGNSLTLTLDPSATFDATLYVISGPCTSGSGCIVESDTGIEGVAETIGPRTFNPGTYYVYVDSIYAPNEGPYQGPYTLSVTGTLGVPNNASFYTLTPCRVIDTRNPTGPLGGPALVAGATRTFTVTGTAPGECQIPSTAKSISVNLTVTQPTSLGYLVLFPGGTAAPLASTINFRAGQTRANNAIVSISASGTLSVLDGQGSGTTHFILDVNGYFQ